MSELVENKELSEREIEVIRLLAAGLSNKEIAGQLYLSVNTIKVHLRNIFVKLDVQSRTEATLAAIQRGWVNVPQSQTGAQPAAEMIYAPVELPRIVVEPPLPGWRRAVLIGAAALCIVGLFVSGAAARPGLSSGDNIFSDQPLDAGSGREPSSSTAWQAVAQMPTARTRLATAAYAGRVVAIGGDTQNGATGVVEWFDPVTDEWTAGTSKPTAVSNVSAAVMSDTIIVPGGTTSSGAPTNIVEVYDPRADDWSPAKALPAPRMAYALAVHAGKVYLFGGWDGSAYSARVFMYDPDADEWSSRASMPGPRGFSAAAVSGDAIYLVGGFDGQVESSACERYLPGEDRWETCPSLSVGRGGLALVTIGPSLYAIGGGWTGYLAFNETYTPGADAWRTIPTPFTGQWRGLSAAVVDSDIIVAGGWNGQYLSVVERYSPYPFKVFVPAAQEDSGP
jgi:DNA-binding CsgD family transcriptional regulator/N-acetylneuraminic acid mutarotase